MSCVNPLLAFDNGLDENGKHQIRFVNSFHPNFNLQRAREFYGKDLMLLPCGHCVACAQDYARTWQARIMCEAEYHEKSCFLTLTYANNPPEYPSKEHLRQFIKAVRNKFGQGVKFFGTGEKGELNHRSHYHIILFGVDFAYDETVAARRGQNLVYTSKSLDHLWNRGYCSIGNLDVASAGYVSKYCDKKKITGLNVGEFVIMSRGLGRQYFQDHYREIFESDFIYLKGNKFKLPRYFLKLALTHDDFYTRILAEDYSDRKRFVAQSFRYNSNKSMCEDRAVLNMAEIKLAEKRNKEVVRNVE